MMLILEERMTKLRKTMAITEPTTKDLEKNNSRTMKPGRDHSTMTEEIQNQK